MDYRRLIKAIRFSLLCGLTGFILGKSVSFLFFERTERQLSWEYFVHDFIIFLLFFCIPMIIGMYWCYTKAEGLKSSENHSEEQDKNP